MTNVLITGGSRGIGAAAVRAFCREGCDVTFLYHKNHSAAHALSEQTGSRAIGCDVADGAAVRKIIESMPPIAIFMICDLESSRMPAIRSSMFSP